MSTRKSIADASVLLLTQIPNAFRSQILEIAQGTNPHVRFSFNELKIIRGTRPHPPHTDREEVRSSITIQFNGAPGGALVAHLFSDGTITTSTRMHEIRAERLARQQQLEAEESKFPLLKQSDIRSAAHATYMATINGIRNSNWSQMEKVMRKQDAQAIYEALLQRQAADRAREAAKQH
ncbi:uncharacterized protein BDZ99DRAFT_557459 [Mytilinidion resinicola]|uniref:Uncharacterized protein n=1 Tax=Mytilinidion resinicola TaxID=574789 RepID=A0A6A6YZX8_9PEZI|nr:uncharacterized protein BDZ99DRAFT_557459 [Mytilinidion resinicola]KAF2813564.1 hypothetical protein BDZ99DRAFT_557459 [Mytilinidion resinicola]